jgi:serine/threonine protein kinase
MTEESIETPTEHQLNVTEVWLEALARGTCDETGFLRAVQMLTSKSPEAGWESLSLLDQYYRRGKIKPEVFRSVKTRLGTQLLGPAMDLDVSVPLSRREESAGTAPKSPPAIVTRTPAGESEAVTAPRTTPARAAAPAGPAPTAAPAPAAPTPAPAPAAPTAAPAPAAPTAAPAPAAPTAAPAPAARAATAAQPTPQARTVSVLTVTPPTPAPAAARPANLTGRGAGREIGPGDVLRGRYLLEAALGQGGTGTVFEAIDRYRLASADGGQRVALKVLHGQAPNQLAELRLEFQHLQSLTHPNIVRAHEYDRDGDVAFFTMEYLSGLSLSRVLSARAPSPLERPHARAIIRDIAAALAHAHAHGVVHGDLNPANIFITDDGEVRVLDFGAAHEPLAGPPLLEHTGEEFTSVAAPRFASFQLLKGGLADARDDLYAFACISYLLLAGKHPFGDRTAVEARDQRLRPARPSGLSRREWLTLRSGLAFDGERRPAGVASWSKGFEQREAAPRLPLLSTLLHASAPVRRSQRASALLFAALALAAAGWWASRHIGSIDGAARQVTSDASAAFANVSSAIAGFRGELSRSRDDAVESPQQQPQPPAPTAATPTARTAPAQPSDQARATPQSRAPVPAATLRAASRSTRPHSGEMSPSSSVPSGAGSRPRIELTADTIEVPLADPAARIVVRRTGSTRGEVSFSWWTEAGTAKPGQDFMLVAPREERIDDGKSFASLFVPVVADATRRRSKSFYVVINNPSAEASLGKRTLTMVTIPASD